MRRAVIYINVLLYFWTGYALVRSAIDIFSTSGLAAQLAGSRPLYAGLRIFAALYTAVCAAGLLRRRPWSRNMAFWWNLALAVIIGGFPAITALWLAAIDGGSVAAVLFSPGVIVGALAALVFIALGIALRSPAMRGYFAREPDANFSEAAPHS